MGPAEEDEEEALVDAAEEEALEGPAAAASRLEALVPRPSRRLTASRLPAWPAPAWTGTVAPREIMPSTGLEGGACAPKPINPAPPAGPAAAAAVPGPAGAVARLPLALPRRVLAGPECAGGGPEGGAGKTAWWGRSEGPAPPASVPGRPDIRDTQTWNDC